MPSHHLSPLDKPLPPQPWGFLATNNFWSRALLTPIAIIFWAGAAVFFTCSNFFALVWWQQALGLMVFFSVWGGLVERWSRKYLARRRTLLFAGHSAALDAAPAEARAAPRGPRDLLDEAPRELVPSREARSEWPIVPTAEFWDYAFERLFGRAAGVANLAFDLAVILALSYPTWTPTIVVTLVMVVLSIWFGVWQRRLLLQFEAGARPGLALAESSGSRGVPEGPGRPSATSSP
ncbi:hypothetical protein [Nannocystis pusilla]|uniref:Glycosyl-4,4'-diaponeurosporenoate acyltransferase n=1 Tax=Nannocystis pusilla TaxID=889268 RepID=A0ABS7TZI7_9BACT|nr:hypothetical protein [Nannocystis pusilla]MBZ5713693.1 hypothetical protein [Nannocystis pusilla]